MSSFLLSDVSFSRVERAARNGSFINILDSVLSFLVITQDGLHWKDGSDMKVLSHDDLNPVFLNHVESQEGLAHACNPGTGEEVTGRT